MENIKPYDKYKPSGIAWLGDIPEHWEVRKLKNISQIETGTTPSKNDSENYSTDGIPWIKPDNLKGFKKLFDSKEKISEKGIQYSRVIPKGSILVCCIGTLGKMGIAGCDLTTNQQINSVTFNENIIGNSLGKYLIFASEKEYWRNATKSVVTMLNKSVQGKIKYCFPISSYEQTAIANFLDYKTAKIDRFIRKKKQLIKLLNEQKAGIINHAVTKGLDATAKLKPSNVKWLGDIPEHWEVKKLKYIVKIEKRIAGEIGFDVLSITQKGIKIKDITSGSGQLSMDYSKYQFVKKGYFAMNHMDLLTGFVDISAYDGVISPDYRVFKSINSNCFDNYLLTLFQLGYFRKIFYAFGRGVSQFGRWRLPSDEFYNFQIPVPPIKEQKAIVEHIEKETSKLNKAIATIEKEIALVQEYRTALIAEAVTGKIDVRDYKVPVLEEEDLVYDEVEEELDMVAEDGEEYQTIEE